MLEQSIEQFIKYITSEKKYSPHTSKSYQQDLRDFLKFLKINYNTGSIEDIRFGYIRSWLASLSENELEASSMNRKISTLKSYFKYCRTIGLIQQNPMRKIVSPKNKKSLPKFVSISEMEMALDIQHDSDGGHNKRMAGFALRMLYETGMRSAELINLCLKDILLAKNCIRVKGKGNKERIIPIQKELIEEIECFIMYRSSLDNVEVDNLIVTKRGMKVYPKLLYNLIHNTLDRVTTISQKSPHVLRHSFATHLADNGAEINAIKELLGHSSLSATQVYTHNSIQKLKDAYQQAHPRAMK